VVITDLRAARVNSPYGWVVVQIRTDAGLTGVGETWYAPGVLDSLACARDAVVGEDPRDVERLVARLRHGRSGTSLAGSEWADCVARHGLAGFPVSEGSTTLAASGTEIALWDLAAKAIDAPVYALLGGRFRAQVPLYLHVARSPGADGLVASAAAARAAGWGAVKVDLEPRFREPLGDLSSGALQAGEDERLHGVVMDVRKAIGDEVELAVDLRHQLDVADAIRLGQRLDSARLLWLEDPIPPGNVGALARVAGAVRTPICIGEVVPSAMLLHPYLEQQACAVVHPDVCYAGIVETRKMAVFAETYQARLALHNSGGPIASIAAAHVAASLQSVIALELLEHQITWWQEFVEWNGPQVRPGSVDLFDCAPGLGVEIAGDAARHYIDDYALLA
jgi:L-alanine-DL-glutamate epimerase-like enolase superfamily enzyme